MQVVHVHDGAERVLASEVSVAETKLQQLKGVMFRDSLPDEYGLVFPFETAKARGVHMLFVRIPIDVIWTVNGDVTAVEELRPWTGFARHDADRIIELPVGGAASVSVGDRVRLEDE